MLFALGSYLRLQTWNHQYWIRPCTTFEHSFGVKILLLFPRKTGIATCLISYESTSVCQLTGQEWTLPMDMYKFRDLKGIKTLPARSGQDPCSVKWCSSSRVFLSSKITIPSWSSPRNFSSAAAQREKAIVGWSIPKWYYSTRLRKIGI